MRCVFCEVPAPDEGVMCANCKCLLPTPPVSIGLQPGQELPRRPLARSSSTSVSGRAFQYLSLEGALGPSRWRRDQGPLPRSGRKHAPRADAPVRPARGRGAAGNVRLLAEGPRGPCRVLPRPELPDRCVARDETSWAVQHQCLQGEGAGRVDENVIHESSRGASAAPRRAADWKALKVRLDPEATKALALKAADRHGRVPLLHQPRRARRAVLLAVRRPLPLLLAKRKVTGGRAVDRLAPPSPCPSSIAGPGFLVFVLLAADLAVGREEALNDIVLRVLPKNKDTRGSR